jgi:hypothetical protein
LDPRLAGLLGWRGEFPNIADKAGMQSLAIARHMFSELGITRESLERPQTLGSRFEAAVRALLVDELPTWDSDRIYQIGSRRITEFQQYAHLARLMMLAAESEVLRTEIGMDYVIKPDVTVGIEVADDAPFLHAAVSCKWTIRSDRVQNIRHEGVLLTRHRRGRQPHIVTVTFEPLPSRLASIARGTGDVDCVYHAAFLELQQAVNAVAQPLEQETLEEIVLQDRLRPLSALAEVIALY